MGADGGRSSRGMPEMKKKASMGKEDVGSDIWQEIWEQRVLLEHQSYHRTYQKGVLDIQ